MRDLAMLKRAAAQFFLEGFFAPEVARILTHTPPELQEAARASLLSIDGQPIRTVPDGAMTWIGHLIWLEQVLEITPVELNAVELEGLIVLKRERARFQAAHPPCPHCGMPNEPHAIHCRECMEAIK